MNKRNIKIGFMLIMTIIVMNLSYKIYSIEKRKIELTQALHVAEQTEKSIKEKIQNQIDEHQKLVEQRKQKQRVLIQRDDSGNEKIIQIIPEEPLPPPPAMMQFSLTDGIRIELNNTTSWNTVLQLIFTLLASYLGVKLINKYVKE